MNPTATEPTIQVKMKLAKVCKNCCKYEAAQADANSTPIKGWSSIYLDKSFADPMPKEITVTVGITD